MCGYAQIYALLQLTVWQKKGTKCNPFIFILATQKFCIPPSAKLQIAVSLCACVGVYECMVVDVVVVAVELHTRTTLKTAFVAVD